jgi:hypothetical protein
MQEKNKIKRITLRTTWDIKMMCLRPSIRAILCEITLPCLILIKFGVNAVKSLMLTDETH